MDIINILKHYKSVAESLNDSANALIIEETINRMERKEFLLPFIGQFSAGKSKLINRIIGKDLLPTKRVETTAFLTFIGYADKEYAVLEYVDGSSRDFEPDEIKCLDHRKASEEKAISALKYYAPIDLLKSGLVIVDTPGVNTLINEHIKITEELLRSTQFMVYVFGSSPSETDIKMITRVENVGIDVLYVRTHVDEIHSDEEDPLTAVKNEVDGLQRILGKEILYYALCNEECCSEYNRWIKQFENFKNYISTCIASTVEEVYTYATLQRLAVMKDSFEKVLNAKLEMLENNAGKTTAEISQTINELTRKKQLLSDKHQREKEELCRNAERRKQRIADEISIQKNSILEDFKESLGKKCDSGALLQYATNFYTARLDSSITNLTNSASERIEEWIEELLSKTKGEINDIQIELQKLDLPFDASFNEDFMNSFELKQDAELCDIAEKYQMLRELDAKDETELSELKIKKEEISQILQQYEDVIAQGNEKVREAINSYQPQMLEQGGRLGTLLKRVGQVGDIAMLLIPAAGWEKAGSMLAAKAAQLAGKTSKMARIGAETLKNLSSVAKTMSKTDTVLDASKLIKYLKDGNGKSPLQELSEKRVKSGILDYLSLSFWFEKAGDMIDPVTYVEDPKYKEEYNRLVRQMQEEVNLQVRQQVEMIKRQRHLIDAEQIKRLEMEERAKIEAETQKELEDEQKRIDSKIAEDKRMNIINNTVSQFKQKLEDYSKLLISRCGEEIDSTTSLIAENAKSFVSAQFDDIEHQLSEMREKMSNSTFSLAQEKECINLQLEKLNLPNE